MARVTASEKEATRLRLIGAAGRAFRRYGFGATGIDGVAKDAGVTSGAFYAHFESKAQIFGVTLAAGLDDLRAGLQDFATRYGTRWPKRFATWYLGAPRRGDLAGACALPALSLEAARSGAPSRAAYTAQLRDVVKLVQSGLESGREADALAMLALLCGGSTIAHALDDERLAARLAKAVTEAVGAIADRTSEAAAG